MNPDQGAQPALTTYAAIKVRNGTTRRMTIQAVDEAEALALCVECGAGLEGIAPSQNAEEVALAYDEKTARRLLGNISRTTLYKELHAGRLERVPAPRRVLITRASLERRLKQR
jgi:ribosomal protein L34E